MRAAARGMQPDYEMRNKLHFIAPLCATTLPSLDGVHIEAYNSSI
jgi:hypothetical protein